MSATAEMIEAPLAPDQLASRWQALCTDPTFDDIAAKIELTEWGEILMGPVGKTHGISASDVVGTIAYHADIPGNAIGKIQIENQTSFVDVPEALVPQVMKQVGKYKIRKQPIRVTLG